MSPQRYGYLIEDMNMKKNNIRGDKHLNPFRDDIVEQVREKNAMLKINLESKVKVSHFYSKNVDLKVGDDRFVEFKSISGKSIAKNFNNRVEEMVGQAALLSSAGSLSYVFIFQDLEGKYEHYFERLRGIMANAVQSDILHSAALLRISKDSVIEDKVMNVKQVIDSIV